jgi:hypothetical protein
VRDVASFANGQGGDIVFGIAEESGAAVKVDGLLDINPDAEILRLQSMIVSVIQPTIFGVDVGQPVRFESGATAIIVRIPGSWSGPHLVTRENENRFWIRRANGKGMMTVDEIRQGFLKGQEVAERARDFRRERLDQLSYADEYGYTPIKLSRRGRLAVHLVPFESFSPGYSVDLNLIHPETGLSIAPMGSPGNDWRFNSNGFVFYQPETETIDCPTYV